MAGAVYTSGTVNQVSKLMQTFSAAETTAVPFAGLLPTRRTLVIAATFIVCYVLLGWATRNFLVRPFAITPWNPAAGLALALLLVCGLRYWPALVAAVLLSNLLVRGIPEPPFIRLLAPLMQAAGYVAMAALLLRALKFRIEFDRLRDVSILVAVAAVGTLAIAIVFVSVYLVADLLPEKDFQPTILRFWIGHLIGIVINTPLLLMLANWPRISRMIWERSPMEIAAQFCAVFFTLWVVFGPGWNDPYKLFYLLFLPLIWIVMRHGILGGTFGIAVIQVGLIVALVRADYQVGTAVTQFQFMMLALAVSGLFLGMAVTESRAARIAKDESESRLSAIVSTAPDSIITVNRHAMVIAANPAAARIFGYSVDELIGKRVHEVLPEFERVAGYGEACELTGVRRDGSHFPAELSVGATGSEAPELRIVVARDITRRKTMERQLGEKQAELGRAARLASAGEMAAALAHELHQPLSAIRNYARASQLMQSPAGGSDLPSKIEHEAARAAEVVQRLRDFFRGGSSRLESISVERLIGGALAPMRDEVARQHIALATDIACGKIELLVDRVQIETVIHSLVGNAIDAISVSTDGMRSIRLAAAVLDNGWVRLSVADSGPGISSAIADRLFEPFATTKLTGIGMGLAMSRSMVEAHDGKLWAEPRADGGTVFHFTLPLSTTNDAADDDR